jgi:hypothetical protein
VRLMLVTSNSSSLHSEYQKADQQLTGATSGARRLTAMGQRIFRSDTDVPYLNCGGSRYL